ncbi:MAG: ribosomal protein S18-alanine N-acetyltransferase [Sphingomonadales bacterium]|nr:ribosomal protein S18-alanine N-acetyltransferase [Sphingomonadales bacterium]MDE2169189.1 ribosomal protein S18-alanine N-acetyltransferase [Sphingomonadales bacterium]
MDDIDRIMTVMQAAFDPFYSESWTRAQVENTLALGNCHYTLIAESGEAAADGEQAVGFALTRSVVDEEELLLFAVLPQHRRRGLGSALLAMVRRNAHMRGIKRIFLEMRHGNTAESLYRSNGFTPIGQRPKYYRAKDGTKIDAITFSLDIDAH